jgi:hypothetical protein
LQLCPRTQRRPETAVNERTALARSSRSPNATDTTFTANPTVTVYHNGVLIRGAEP